MRLELNYLIKEGEHWFYSVFSLIKSSLLSKQKCWKIHINKTKRLVYE